MSRIQVFVWAMFSAASLLHLTIPALAGPLEDSVAAYNSGDYPTALRLLRPLAEQGEPQAQYNLGYMYWKGIGVPQNQTEAAKWIRRASVQGHALSQYILGNMYTDGKGVPLNHADAAMWIGLAAEKGLAVAQHKLSTMYSNGHGVPQDYVMAHMWLNLAISRYVASETREREIAIQSLKEISRRMTQGQIAAAQKLARDWKPAQHTAAGTVPTPVPLKPKHGLTSSGSGFVVSNGYVLTNAHVIADCAEVSAKRPGAVAVKAAVVARDERNDLALLEVALADVTVAKFSHDKGVRQGDAVVAIGFPLHGVLASEANIVTGTVSALAGIRDDSRQLQITAPIQPGNSGGPLLDTSGNVVGIIVAKLNALKVAGVTGDIPQNVNFAIKAELATLFLSSKGVVVETAPSTNDLKPADIGDKAKMFTLLIECWK